MGDLEHSQCDYMHLEAMGEVHGGSGNILLDPSSEKEGFEEEWEDPVGQQLVAQLVMTIGICFL